MELKNDIPECTEQYGKFTETKRIYDACIPKGCEFKGVLILGTVGELKVDETWKQIFLNPENEQ